MDADFLTILGKISACRIVPGNEQPVEYLLLKNILSTIPHFYTSGGSIFLGEIRQEDIKPDKVCLHSKLAGSGGILKRGTAGKYRFACIYGYPRPEALLGRVFGAYNASTGRKLLELTVEHVQGGKDGAFVYFFPNSQEEKTLNASGALVVCNPSEYNVIEGAVSSWNLSSHANTALAVYAAQSWQCYAWLSESTLPGLVDARRVELRSFQNTALTAPYGCLDVGNDSLVKDPTEIEKLAGLGNLSVWLGISNLANGNLERFFVPEAIKLAVLSEYLDFVKKVIKTVAETTRTAYSLQPVADDVEVVDLTAEISEIIREASDFADFLCRGLPKLSDIFRRYGLVFSKVGALSFEELRLKLKTGAVPAAITSEEVLSLARQTRELVIKSLPKGFFFCTNKVRVVSLLLGSARVLSSGKGLVFISPDRPGQDIKLLLRGELLYSFALGALLSATINPKRAHFLAEGLKYSLMAKMDGTTLAEALHISEAAYLAYENDIQNLREKARGYFEGDICVLCEGKYHKCFKTNPQPDEFPFEARRFLAAHDSDAAMKSLNFYEEALS